MKASSKPTKPTPPREPVRPTKVYLESGPMRVSISAYTTLAALLSEVDQLSNMTWGTSRHATGAPPFDQIKTTYTDEDSIDLVWDQEIEVTLTDEQFIAALSKHDCAMEVYRGKLKRYETDLISYDVSLVRWEDEVKRKETERELTELARLKAKHEQAS